MKNFFGIESHYTDDFIHWTQDIDSMYKIRNLYKKALEGDENAIIKLLERAFAAGMRERDNEFS